MPFSVLLAFAVVSLVVLALAVLDTVRVQKRHDSDPAVAFMYRAYGA